MAVDHVLEMPYAFRDLQRRDIRNFGYHGGRGSGKSQSVASHLVLRGREQPLRIFCGRELQKSISDSVKQLLDDKIEASGLRDFYTSTQYSIKGRNGTRFAFGGLRSNPDAIKSFEGIDIAWIEEAATISQASLELLIPTVRKPGSQLIYTWNRRFTADPVDAMFLGEGGPPPRSIVRKVNWDDNKWFPDVLREKMIWDKSRDFDKYLHVWEGEPVMRSDAKVFTNWRVEDLDDQVPPESVPRLGLDFGFGDPTVLIECFIWGRTLYFRSEAYKVRCEIDEMPSLMAGSDYREPPRWKNTHNHPGVPSAADMHWPIVADSSRPDTIKYLRDRGFNITASKKGAGSVEDGVEFMKSYDIVVHPRCQQVIDELNLYSYRIDPLTDEVLPVLADKNNHTIDACRYSVEGVRRQRRGRRLVAPQTVKLTN